MRLLLFVFATVVLLSVVVAQEYPDDEGVDPLEHELERFFLWDWIKGGVKKAGGFVKDGLHAVGNVFG
uniref:Antimicrobial peptide n=1 Tax=Panagrellus redivivus TaxID=6233 RepID=A0A7E4VQQ6_PANRE